MLTDKFYKIIAQGGFDTPNPPSGPPSAPPVSSFKIEISNPLTGIDSIPELINKILEIMVTIGLPLVGIFIIYCGFLFVTAAGNQSKIDNAKKTFFYTIIGAAIVLGAFVISSVIEQTVGVLKQ